MAELRWLSPSSTWLISQCPAAASPVTGKGFGTGPLLSADAGSLAHEAVRRWIEGGSWRSDITGKGLAKGFDEAARAAGVQTSAVERGVLTRARLRASWSMLQKAIGGDDEPAVECEVVLEDLSLGLRGRADILVTSGDSAVLDLKTGAQQGAEVNSQVRYQLLLYAHLFRVRHGQLPQRLEVLSLSRGRLTVPFTSLDVEMAVEDLASAWSSVGGAATPSEQACRFCNRRLRCDPYWGLDPSARPGSVAGEVLKTTTAATGSVGLHVEPDIWVTQLRPSQVPAGLQPGAHVRLIDLRGSHSTNIETLATGRTRGVVTHATARP